MYEIEDWTQELDISEARKNWDHWSVATGYCGPVSIPETAVTHADDEKAEVRCPDTEGALRTCIEKHSYGRQVYYVLLWGGEEAVSLTESTVADEHSGIFLWQTKRRKVREYFLNCGNVSCSCNFEAVASGRQD